MPMDISFAVHDAFRVVRPGWKLPTNLEQAGSLFAEACRENYQAASAPPAPEPEDAEAEEVDGDIDGEGAVKARRPGGMEEAGSTEDGEVSRTGTSSTARDFRLLTGGRMNILETISKRTRTPVKDQTKMKNTLSSLGQRTNAIRKLTPSLTET